MAVKRVSVYFYLAAASYLFSVLALSASGFKTTLATRPEFITIAFILFGFGVIFFGAFIRVTRRLKATSPSA